MPFYNIAGLTLEITGEENEFFNTRFAEYRTESVNKSDLKVDFSDNPFSPEGELVSVMDGFRQYFRQSDGFGIYDLCHHDVPHPGQTDFPAGTHAHS